MSCFIYTIFIWNSQFQITVHSWNTANTALPPPPPLNQLSLGHILAFILWGSRHSSCIARLTVLGKYALPIPGRKCGLYFYISLAFFSNIHTPLYYSLSIHNLWWPNYTFFDQNTPFFDQNTLFVTKIHLLWNSQWQTLFEGLWSICIIFQVLNHIRSFIDLSNYSYLKMKTENIK